MPSLAIAGTSYGLRNRAADVQRCINWMPVQIESGVGKGGQQAYLKQAPGKVVAAILGAEVRGMITSRGVLYAVAGPSLLRVNADWSTSFVGTIASASGPVGLADNRTQICITDGASGYVYDLDTGSMTALSGAWLGSARVDVLDGYGVFHKPGDWTLYTSAQQDFTTLNALDFGSAESSTGSIVAIIVKHRELIVLKERTGEIWYDAGNAEGIALSPNTGSPIEAGCIAPFSLQKMAGLALWLGQDERGTGIVYAMQAYQPQRVSNHALEEALSALTAEQMAGARAYTYHQEGLSFYVLQVPGLTTTWVYELAAGIWHERAEMVDGAWAQDLGTCHAMAYGHHVVGTDDGRLLRLDQTVNTSAGRYMVRERTTPHNAAPELSRKRFGSLQVDCSVGQGLSGGQGVLMLQHSNDGGNTWSSWRDLPLGRIGEYVARARATMLGSARDRVWRIRVSDDVRCEPVAMVVDER